MMRSAPWICRVGPRHSPIAVAVAAVVLLDGCATVPGGGTADRPAIAFHNQTDNYVRLYLVQGSTYWPIGRVAPMQMTRLKLPASIDIGSPVSVQLAAVPLASPRGPQPLGPPDPGMIRSVPDNLGTLLSMRWRLSGKHLWSSPFPRERVEPPVPVRTRTPVARVT